MRKRITIFLSGAIQITLSSMNVVFLIHGLILPTIVTGFCVTLLWTLNVRKCVFGDIWDRVLYSLGACSGMVSGYYLAKWASKLF